MNISIINDLYIQSQFSLKQCGTKQKSGGKNQYLITTKCKKSLKIRSTSNCFSNTSYFQEQLFCDNFGHND